MAEQPDDLATARRLLAEQRERGAGFNEAWQVMLAALPPIEQLSARAREREETLNALSETVEDWRAAFERDPLHRRCPLTPMGA